MFKAIHGSATRHIRNTATGTPRTTPDRRNAVPVVRTVNRSIQTAERWLQDGASAARDAIPLHQSAIWRRTQECIADIRRLEIGPNLAEDLEALNQKHSDDLESEAKHCYEQMDVHAIDGSPTSRTMLAAQEISMMLKWGPSFVKAYNVSTKQMPLMMAISRQHFEYLAINIQTILRELSDQDRRTFVEAIKPGVLEQLGCTLPLEEKRLQEMARLSWNQLGLEHLLSVVDYVNVDTKKFVPINCAQRLSVFSGLPIFGEIVSCVSQSMREALLLLIMNEKFVYRGNLFKGVDLNNPAGPYLRYVLTNGKPFTLAHPTSTTSNPEKSYHNPLGEYTAPKRDSNIALLGASGVSVKLFHHTSTAAQDEVLIMPSMAFRGTSVPEELTRQWNSNPRDTYCCEADEHLSAFNI